MTWLKRSAVAALIVLPLTAMAFGPREHHEPDADEIALHLAERLGLSDELALDVAERLVAMRTDGQALKQRARAEAEALAAAVEAGDEKQMKASMKGLERIREDGESLKDALTDDLKSMLTVEQQAMMTLLHMERREKHVEILQRLKERRELGRGL